MEMDFDATAAEAVSCRYAICDESSCNVLYNRLTPLEAQLRGRPRMEAPRPLPANGDKMATGVSQLRQVYHFDPMKLLAVFDHVSLHHDYIIEFLLHRPTPGAAPEARVYVRKRFVPAFIRNAQQFDMVFSDDACALHHIDFERSAEGVLQFFLLWFHLTNLFRPVDRQSGGELALYAEAQKTAFEQEYGHALAAAQRPMLKQLDLRPRVALGENSATVQLHSFDWQHGVREREFRIVYPHRFVPLGTETLIPVPVPAPM